MRNPLSPSRHIAANIFLIAVLFTGCSNFQRPADPPADQLPVSTEDGGATPADGAVPADDAAASASDASSPDTGGEDAADPGEGVVIDLDGASSSGVDAASPETGTGDAAPPQGCIDGTLSRGQGETCKCDQDCKPEASHCGRNLLADRGTEYCSKANCGSDNDCPSGYACFKPQFGGGNTWCEKCKGAPNQVDLGGACICTRDCKSGQTCERSVCSITGCKPGDPSTCPAGFQCIEGGRLNPTATCAKCTAAAGSPKISMGGACECPDDCDAGLICDNRICTKTNCKLPPNDDCPSGFRCEKPLLGSDPPKCVAGAKVQCAPAGSVKIGGACKCDTDCDPSAPLCLSAFGFSLCTIENCDAKTHAPCPAGFKCQNGFGARSNFCRPN